MSIEHSPARQQKAAAKLPTLTALELERHIDLDEAARIKGVSVDTLRRHYGHLIRRPSPRRCTIKIRDLLSDDAGPQAA
jgi:hypothetical protein